MNKPQFLSIVDSMVEPLGVEELRLIVHELAVRAPEGERDAFVRLVRSHTDGARALAAAGRDETGDLLSRLDEVIETLVAIEDEEYALARYLNEEWDDWYDSEEDEFEFADPSGVTDVVDSALGLMHTCLDEAHYRWGCALGMFLSELRLEVEDDICGDETFGIAELFAYDLVNGRIEDFVGEASTHILFSMTGDQAASAVWRLMERTRCHRVRIEDMLRRGPDVPAGFDGFLASWISLLGTQQGYYVDGMLDDAIGYLDDPNEVFDVASRNASTHPEVFESVLSKQAGAGEDAWVERRGIEALDLIPVKRRERSRVALITADAAVRLQHLDVVESCWFEAFRSDMSSVNYLRLRMGVRDWTAVADGARAELEGRSLPITAKSGVLFFDGRLEEAFTLGLSEKGYLGWSSTFMKTGIALFLLLLNGGEAATLPRGLSHMVDYAITGTDFTATGYHTGTGRQATENDRQTFLEVFGAWKATVSVSDDDARRWLSAIDQRLVGRVDAIMQANRRNYYFECASFVAALGEVRESRGEQGEKVRALLAMRDRYPRRRNFIQDLRSFGMPDRR